MLLVASDVGDALEASETLGRRGFSGCAFCLAFVPQIYSDRNNYPIAVEGRRKKCETGGLDGGLLNPF